MEAEQIKEWQDFRANANSLLEQGHPIPKGTKKVLHVLVMPSFASSKYIELFQVVNTESEFVLSQSEWNMELDLDKFRTPLERLKHPRQLSPSITRVSKMASSKSVEKILNMANSARVPLRFETSILGLDGTEFKLGLENHRGRVEYSWWEKPPTEWEVLGKLADLVIQHSKSLFEA